jgi:DNA-binding transcriptional LysR family regulator
MTVSNGNTATAALRRGLAYGSAPETLVQADIDAGRLKPLLLSEGSSREVRLALVLADSDYAGPATRFVAEQLLKQAKG